MTDFALVPDWPTVLFVGDSFTEGLDVASADTFVNVFGRHMKDGGLPGTAVNAGVNGYGALEQMPRSVPESPFERPSALLAPVTALCSPTVSYNILVGLSFVGSAFGVYLLCLFLLDGDGRRAAFLAGAAYALSAPRSSG